MNRPADHKAIPGPRGLPILGVMPEMVRDLLKLLTSTARQYGGIAQFKLLNKNYILLSNPDYVKYILQDNHKNYIRGRSVETGRVLLGNGLPLIDGDFWLRERRILQPAFHRERLGKLVVVITGVIDTFLRDWEAKARNHLAIDMDDEMMRLTLAVIIKSMFRANVDDKIESLSHAFSVASKFMLWRSQQIWAPPLFVLPFWSNAPWLADTFRGQPGVHLLHEAPEDPAFYIPGDGHPTAAGHRRFAADLAPARVQRLRQAPDLEAGVEREAIDHCPRLDGQGGESGQGCAAVGQPAADADEGRLEAAAHVDVEHCRGGAGAELGQ